MNMTTAFFILFLFLFFFKNGNDCDGKLTYDESRIGCRGATALPDEPLEFRTPTFQHRNITWCVFEIETFEYEPPTAR